MGKISNHYEKCQLLNLGYGPKGRGPFVIRQDAYLPASESLKEDRFLLRKDGTWVLNLAVFALPEKEKEQFLYENTAEAVKMLQELPGVPVVEDGLPEGKSRAELARAAESTISGIWGRISAAKASRIAP